LTNSQTGCVGFSDTVNFGASSRPELNGLAVALYPNPASDVVTLELTETSARAQVAVLDLQGRILLQKEAVGVSTLEVSALTPGIYLVRVQADGRQGVRRLYVTD
jgi:hypothetical protein